MNIRKLFLIIFLFGSQHAFAQNHEMSKVVSDCLDYGKGGGVSLLSIEYMFFGVPIDERSTLFSIVIETNQNGVIEKVAFTQGAANLDKIVSLKSVSTYLKTKKQVTFKPYKNAYIIIPVWVMAQENITFKATPAALESFKNLIPDTKNRRSNKKLHVFPTVTYGIYNPRV
ncbi:hypothetical protein [Pedobacter sp. GR22-6]|uniref:hypothetical protein n=1 Tax=Pedobacter sp. GR22-6 TaxID=3127957 RepID=UPI00307CD676